MIRIPFLLLVRLFVPSKLKQKKKNHIGKIYAVNPKHIVKKRDWESYEKIKGKNANNDRLVMVGVQKKNKKVQVSNLTTKATSDQIDKKHKVRLYETYKNKKSYVDTNTIGKSRLTGKNFKVGQSPLNKPIKKAKDKDIQDYQNARKVRGR